MIFQIFLNLRKIRIWTILKIIKVKLKKTNSERYLFPLCQDLGTNKCPIYSIFGLKLWSFVKKNACNLHTFTKSQLNQEYSGTGKKNFCFICFLSNCFKYLSNKCLTFNRIIRLKLFFFLASSTVLFIIIILFFTVFIIFWSSNIVLELH